MDWRWRGLSAGPSLQRTSKAPTKGAVKEAAMVKLPLLCSELVLQAMKVIFSRGQGKSADGNTNSLAQKSVGTYNWLTWFPWLSQHGANCGTECRQKNTYSLLNIPNMTYFFNVPSSCPWVLLCSLYLMQIMHPTACRQLWSSISCSCQQCWFHIYWLYTVGSDKTI